MEIEFSGDFAASASELDFGKFILVSHVTKGETVYLVEAQQVEFRGKNVPFLRQRIREVTPLQPLDALALRQNFSSEFGQIMTDHLMKVLDHIGKDPTEVVSYTAWRYRNLTSWGEASAARELALHMDVPVHTIHNRLRIARERGILSAPGSGSRFGR
jgi:hypothetical protein